MLNCGSSISGLWTQKCHLILRIKRPKVRINRWRRGRASRSWGSWGVVGASGLCSAAGVKAEVREWAWVHGQVAARFSGLVSELVAEMVCLHLSASRATSPWRFPSSEFPIPKDRITMWIHRRNYWPVSHPEAANTRKDLGKHETKQISKKITGSERESTLWPEMLCVICWYQGGHKRFVT